MSITIFLYHLLHLHFTHVVDQFQDLGGHFNLVKSRPYIQPGSLEMIGWKRTQSYIEVVALKLKTFFLRYIADITGTMRYSCHKLWISEEELIIIVSLLLFHIDVTFVNKVSHVNQYWNQSEAKQLVTCTSRQLYRSRDVTS